MTVGERQWAMYPDLTRRTEWTAHVDHHGKNVLRPPSTAVKSTLGKPFPSSLLLARCCSMPRAVQADMGLWHAFTPCQSLSSRIVLAPAHCASFAYFWCANLVLIVVAAAGSIVVFPLFRGVCFLVLACGVSFSFRVICDLFIWYGCYLMLSDAIICDVCDRSGHLSPFTIACRRLRATSAETSPGLEILRTAIRRAPRRQAQQVRLFVVYCSHVLTRTYCVGVELRTYQSDQQAAASIRTLLPVLL